MSPFYLRRYITPLIHVLVWGLFGLTLILLNPLLGRITVPPQFWVKQAVVFALWVGAFYLTARVSVPRLLFRGHIGRFVLVLLITAAVVVALSQLLELALNLRPLLDQAFAANKGTNGWRPGPPRPPGESSFRFDMKGLLTILLVLGISTAVSVVQQWQQDDRRRQDLEQQKISSELSFLKAQINPHFFFNTLNNIYALTVIDGEKARQALHTLSRMMRYVLYETPAGTTPLSKELDFVQDYVALMQLRLTDKVTLTFERPTAEYDVPVAPMLLLPFVENAFKHGVDAVQPSSIYIAVRQPEPHTVELEVRNTHFAGQAASLDASTGIGLTNTRRRLDLLYPGRFQLLVSDHAPDNTYRVHLTLQV